MLVGVHHAIVRTQNMVACLRAAAKAAPCPEEGPPRPRNSGDAGSPLLLLDVAQDVLSARSTRLREFVCHFVESDPDNYANLRDEVERHPAVHSGRVVYGLSYTKRVDRDWG